VLDVGDYFPPRRVDDPEFGADPHGVVGGYVTPDAGFVDDPMLAAVNLMDAARRSGATLRLNAEVTGIRHAGGRVTGVDLAGGEQIAAPIVVNVAGPASGKVNAMAGVTAEMRIGHRPLRQEVHVVEAPAGFGLDDGTIVTDLGLGSYFRPHLGGTLVVGGTEPKCDPLEWIDDPDRFNDRPTVEGFERNVYRMARRLPTVKIPHRPVGLAALYDASDDWVPFYDKTSLAGFYLACGSSGNQFKNAPLAGVFVAELIEAAERGHDHDLEPIRVRGARTGFEIDLGAFSRRREPTETSGTVLG
jgi:sarcosine oxidase subunit beta